MTAATLSPDPIALTDCTRRLLELRNAIIEGTYVVDPQAVAAALIREWTKISAAPIEPEKEVAPATKESMRHFVVRPREAGTRFHA